MIFIIFFYLIIRLQLIQKHDLHDHLDVKDIQDHIDQLDSFELNHLLYFFPQFSIRWEDIFVHKALFKLFVFLHLN